MMRAASWTLSFSVTHCGLGVITSRTDCPFLAMVPPSLHKKEEQGTYRFGPASERDAQPSAHGDVTRPIVVIDHVVRGLGHDAVAPAEREVAVHAAAEAVVGLVRAAVLGKDVRVAAEGAVLAVEAGTKEEAGRAERLGETVVDDGVDVVDVDLFQIAALDHLLRVRSAAGRHPERPRRGDLADLDLEEGARLELDGVERFLDRV